MSLTSPANGATFAAPANITLSATAADADGTIAKVEFFKGGTTLINTVTVAPYTYNWTNVPGSSYTLTAKATDNLGAVTTSSPINITVTPNSVPTVSMTSPANGATFAAPASITLTATAADPDGIAQVEFFHGGTTLISTATVAPYTFNWTNVAAGSYVLTAKAIDNVGSAAASSPVNITVGANVAPSVSLTSPANGATFTAPASITLSATAADSDGTVTQVQFLQGSTLLNTATVAPYTFNWTNVAAGSYALTARATDNLSAATTSAPVNITVNVAPALYFIQPDQLNTPRVITNPAQQVVWRWDNDEAFGGNAANGNPGGLGAFEFNLRFPGQYFDKETNNHYNYYRDYSPEIGRYIESDPIGLRGGLNTYAYVTGSPLRFNDPFGLTSGQGNACVLGKNCYADCMTGGLLACATTTAVICVPICVIFKHAGCVITCPPVVFSICALATQRTCREDCPAKD